MGYLQPECAQVYTGTVKGIRQRTVNMVCWPVTEDVTLVIDWVLGSIDSQFADLTLDT
jgi:hypothetical protein